MRAPSPRATTNGSPPTPPNARTGELTPPGKSSRARAMSSADRAPFGDNPGAGSRELQARHPAPPARLPTPGSLSPSPPKAPDRRGRGGADEGEPAGRPWGCLTRGVDHAHQLGLEVVVVHHVGD